MAQRLVSCRLAMLAIWIVAAPMVAAAAQRSPCVPPAGTQLVEFRSGDNVLRGFIDLPAGKGRHPAIMLIHGGADTDVTADVDYWKELRAAFRRAGIATLAWDKAGNGCSSGSYSSRLLPIQERVTEALAALEILKRREDIDPTRIGLWALSQGGWVAPMVAVRSRSIAYLIVVSGPGRDALSLGLYPAIHVLREAGVSGPEADAAYWTLRRSLAVLRAGGTAEELLLSLRRYANIQRCKRRTGSMSLLPNRSASCWRSRSGRSMPLCSWSNSTGRHLPSSASVMPWSIGARASRCIAIHLPDRVSAT